MIGPLSWRILWKAGSEKQDANHRILDDRGPVGIFSSQPLEYAYACGREEEIMFSDFMAKLDQGAVEKVTMQGHRLTGVLKDNSQVRTYMADYPDLVQMLREKHVQIEVRPQGESAWYVTVLMTWGPFVFSRCVAVHYATNARWERRPYLS